jgi:2-methylisocitrate lyase-like PEP mutase family enzyme
MNLTERYKKPTPKFFRTLRNIGIALAATGGAIIAAPISLPALVLTIAGYLTVAGTVATAVSQAVVVDIDDEGLYDG